MMKNQTPYEAEGKSQFLRDKTNKQKYYAKSYIETIPYRVKFPTSRTGSILYNITHPICKKPIYKYK